MVRDKLALRTATLTESATLALNAKAKSMAASGKTIYNLTAGELATETPINIQVAVSKKLNQNKYTPVAGLADLRQSIADYAKQYYGLDWINKDNIVVTSGAKPALYATFLSLINPGDEVIVLTPAWVSYVDLIQLVGGVVVPVALTETYDLDIDKISKAFTSKTKAIIINSPNNPTGSVYSKESLKAVSKIVNKSDITVISDDIYSKLIFVDDYFLPAKAGFNDLVVISGFSKSQSLTGWRIGYLIAKEPIAKAATKFLSHITGNAPLPSQIAGIEAMAKNDSPPAETINSLKDNRKILIEGLSKIPGIKFNIPSGAFYVYLDLRALTDNSLNWCEDLLNETGVAIVPGDAFLTPGYARLTFSGDSIILKKALKELNNFVLQGVSNA